ncbi:MAG: hypothetical protein AB1896_07630, partial [Thermodesulfobacteriota bacterium]
KVIARSVLFFPYTDVSQARLARALLLFGQVLLYRLPLSRPAGYLAEAEEKGLARPVEADFFEDRAELSGLVKGLSRLAETYRDPGTLALLRNLSGGDDPERSGARLMTAIRSYSGLGPWRDQRREAQVFLHFLEDLDRRQGEIDELYAEAGRKEAALGEIMGLEPSGGETGIKPPAPAWPETVGLEFMPRRLAAWGRFFQAFGPHDLPLFTDQPEAVAALDLNLAKARPGQGTLTGRPFEALEPLFSFRLDPGPDQPLTIGEAVGRRRAGEDFSNFTALLLSRAWAAGELESLRRRAADLVPGPGGGSWVLSGYLLPGRDLKEAYAAAAGLAAPPAGAPVFCGPLLELRTDG